MLHEFERNYGNWQPNRTQLIKELLRLKNSKQTFLSVSIESTSEGDLMEIEALKILDFNISYDLPPNVKREIFGSDGIFKIKVFYEYTEPVYEKLEYDIIQVAKLEKYIYEIDISSDCIFWDDKLETLVFFPEMESEEKIKKMKDEVERRLYRAWRIQQIRFYNREIHADPSREELSEESKKHEIKYKKK